MRRAFLALLALSLWIGAPPTRAQLDAIPAFSEDETAWTPEISEVPSAADLLGDVLDRLPREPLLVTGAIRVRRRHGTDERKLRFEMELRWGDPVPSARYRIMDALGQDLEDLVISQGQGAPRLNYVSIASASTEPPSLSKPIQDTDLTWSDLTLAFLWWEGGTVLGRDKVLGRPCWIVEVPVPAQAREAAGGAMYAKVRLWVDAAYRLLLQAEALDEAGRGLRRLWVRSIKKVGERWMIKDLEVEGANGSRRTKLTVEDVRPLR